MRTGGSDGVHGRETAGDPPEGRRARVTAGVLSIVAKLAVPAAVGSVALPIVALPIVAPSPALAAASVTTVAGTGHPGTAGGTGAATSAELDGPTGIALDASGDLFVADTGACAVDEIPVASGTRYGVSMQAHHLYTVAGGTCGNRARPGAVGHPTGVAVDAAGDVFVADATGDRVLVLRPGHGRLGASARDALVTVVAGTGRPGTAGLGGPAREAELDSPAGVATDASGDLFVADTEGCRLDEVPAAAGTNFGVAMQAHDLYSVAGTGTCGATGLGGPAAQADLFLPTAVAVDAAGDLLIANRGTGQVLEEPVAAGTYFGAPLGADDLGVVAGAGIYAPYLTDGLPARGTTAEINFPYGLAVAPDGDLYVTDTASSAIRQVPASDGAPFGRTVTAGDLYTLVGAVPTGPNDTGTRWVTTEVTTPYGIAVNRAGDVFYSDRGADVVREVRP